MSRDSILYTDLVSGITFSIPREPNVGDITYPIGTETG